MSSSETLNRALRAGLLLGALALPLAGCIRPMYGEAKLGGGSVEAALKKASWSTRCRTASATTWWKSFASA